MRGPDRLCCSLPCEGPLDTHGASHECCTRECVQRPTTRCGCSNVCGYSALTDDWTCRETACVTCGGDIVCEDKCNACAHTDVCVKKHCDMCEGALVCTDQPIPCPPPPPMVPPPSPPTPPRPTVPPPSPAPTIDNMQQNNGASVMGVSTHSTATDHLQSIYEASNSVSPPPPTNIQDTEGLTWGFAVVWSLLAVALLVLACVLYFRRGSSKHPHTAPTLRNSRRPRVTQLSTHTVQQTFRFPGLSATIEAVDMP